MSFRQVLREARLRAGLSQAQVAGDRFSISYISHLEAGRRAPTPEVVRFLEDRLDLPPGSLARTIERDGQRPPKPSGSEALGLYNQAKDTWQAGEFGEALELAEEVQQSLPNHGRDDLAVLVTQMLVNINIDLGRYEEATNQAHKLVEATTRSGSLIAETQAWCLASRAARANGSSEIAQESAQNALRLTATSEVNRELRATALMTALAADAEAHGDSASTHAKELENLITQSHMRDHAKGLGAWVLGVIAFREGRITEGKMWHENADLWLSPAADFRNWARFPRASAYERLKAGVTEGVQELLDEASSRVALLNSPDEVASLSIAVVRFALYESRLSDALSAVEAALQEPGLPELTRGELYLARAEACRQSGDDEARRAAALSAARIFAEVGNAEKGRQAWAFFDE